MNKLKYNNILVISDNLFLITAFHELSLGFPGLSITYACSQNNLTLLTDPGLPVKLEALAVKTQHSDIVSRYDLVFSLHCKQFFPIELVSKVKCINVHPGYNPHNRGWFPQVFSILNKLPAGVTIHEIDEHLDHGAIIARKEVKINSWDTSVDIYNNVQQVEVDLLKEYLPAILKGTYQTNVPEMEGNVNLKKDFNELCILDLEETVTMGVAIDKLRALTHGNYANGFFIDPETGVKVYVKISLKKEG